MLYDKVVEAALQWAADARKDLENAIWAEHKVQGAAPYYRSVRLLTDKAEFHAQKSIGLSARQAAEHAVGAAEAAADAAGDAAQSLVADRQWSVREREFNSAFAASLVAKARTIFFMLGEMATPKKEWEVEDAEKLWEVAVEALMVAAEVEDKEKANQKR